MSASMRETLNLLTRVQQMSAEDIERLRRDLLLRSDLVGKEQCRAKLGETRNDREPAVLVIA